MDLSIEAIYNGQNQNRHSKNWEKVRSGEVSVLITTRLAIWGINIKQFTLVINYDTPKNIQEYVYGVSQSGCNEISGNSIILMTMNHFWFAAQLKQFIDRCGQCVPPELDDMIEMYETRKEERKEMNAIKERWRKIELKDFDDETDGCMDDFAEVFRNQ